MKKRRGLITRAKHLNGTTEKYPSFCHHAESGRMITTVRTTSNSFSTAVLILNYCNNPEKFPSFCHHAGNGRMVTVRTTRRRNSCNAAVLIYFRNDRYFHGYGFSYHPNLVETHPDSNACIGHIISTEYAHAHSTSESHLPPTTPHEIGAKRLEVEASHGGCRPRVPSGFE